jgi:serine/threonine protein kinase
VRGEIIEYFIIMEQGETSLDKYLYLLKKEGKFISGEQVIEFANQLIKTLSDMQKNNFSHRDLKPHNILLKGGKLKLCDFGTAK